MELGSGRGRPSDPRVESSVDGPRRVMYRSNAFLRGRRGGIGTGGGGRIAAQWGDPGTSSREA